MSILVFVTPLALISGMHPATPVLKRFLGVGGQQEVGPM